MLVWLKAFSFYVSVLTPLEESKIIPVYIEGQQQATLAMQTGIPGIDAFYGYQYNHL